MENKNKFEKIKKFKNIYLYVLSFLASFVGIFLNFFLAKVLGAEEFGQIQYLVALATTCSQVLLFGLSSFLIREAKNKKQTHLFDKCCTLYFAIIIFFVPLIYFYLITFGSNTVGNTFLVFIVLATSVLMGLNSLISSFFQGNGKYHLTLIFENFIPKFLMLLIAVIFIVIGKLNTFSSNYLVFYIIVYSLIAIPFTIRFFRGINFSFTKAELLSVCFFSGVTITYSLGNNLTKVLQGGLFHNNVALAIISVSISLINLVKVLTNVLDNLIKPVFAKQKRNNEIDKMFDTYRFDIRINSYISIPLYLFFIIHSYKFLSIFGESYLAYTNILVIIAVANMVNDITGPSGTLLAMTGKEKWELFNGFIYFTVYIASIFIFSHDKIYGLCLALLVAQIIVNILKYIEVSVIYKINPINLKTLLTLLIIFVTDGVVIFVLRFINLSLYLWIIVGVLIGIIILFLNVFVLSLYRKSDFRTLRDLKV